MNHPGEQSLKIKPERKQKRTEENEGEKREEVGGVREEGEGGGERERGPEQALRQCVGGQVSWEQS